MHQPWLARWLGHWTTFNWVVFSQFALIFAVPFLLPESSRWLLSKGRKDKVRVLIQYRTPMSSKCSLTFKALEILKKIAKFNKKTVSEEIWEQVGQFSDEQMKAEKRFKLLGPLIFQ